MQNKMIFLGMMNRFLHPEVPMPDLDALTQPEVQELLVMGRIHAVFPVVYDALRQTKAFCALPEEARLAMKQEIRWTVVGQAMRTELFLNLYRKILDAGITPLVVKGIVLRSLYENPDYRISNDEDVLVRKEDFFHLDDLLLAQGYSRTLPENPLQEHEITYWNGQTGIHLEIHLSLFPEDSEAYGYLNAPFADAFERQVVEKIRGVPIHTLEPTQHMLYLVCHGLKHFLHSGFGVRQVMDMIAFAEHFGNQIDWIMMEKWARKQGYYLFWMNLFDLGERYLGFSWEKAGIYRPGQLKLDCGAMLEDLLDGGIYGKSTENRVHSANITLQAMAGSHKSGGLMASAFPGMAYMKACYPYLEHHGWLLPVAWGQRMVCYLRRSGHQEIRDTVSMGNRRVELLKQYGLAGKKSR